MKPSMYITEISCEKHCRRQVYHNVVLNSVLHKLYEEEDEEQLTACKEDLKQALQAKAQRLRRYIKRSEQYKQNKMFREDSKRFYRELGKKTNSMSANHLQDHDISHHR